MSTFFAPIPSPWLGELKLCFESRGGKTLPMRRRHRGPLVVQRPFHPEADGTRHVYLLHPPGGIAGETGLARAASSASLRRFLSGKCSIWLAKVKAAWKPRDCSSAIRRPRAYDLYLPQKTRERFDVQLSDAFS